MRAAVRRAGPRRLRASAARPGFGPALEALISELQAALISPRDFAASVAELDQPGYERELAAMYGAYIELRDAAGRGDEGIVAERTIAALRSDPSGWRERPVLLYGFDELTRSQLEVVGGLAAACDVTVAVNYADRRALAVRARLLGQLTEELGAEAPAVLRPDDGHIASATLRHLDRNLFEPDARSVEPDEGLVLLESAGARGEAEAIGVEIARLLADGHDPDAIAIVVRHPDAAGPLLASVLRELGLPVALEASLPLAATAVGGSLIALCRAGLDDGAVEALLAHLRADPALEPSIADGVERRIRRGSAQTVSAAIEGWRRPPRHLERLREAADDSERLRGLARSARELAEDAHRDRAPLAGRRRGEPGAPFSALELRASVAASELLDELAKLGSLPGCEQPGLAEAIEAIESASVPHWRGPASGRIRILSPSRARVARARALFCASLQDGEFPSSAPPDPLLSEERRREIGNPDLRRIDQADQERYLFHACVSRPTERLYLSWQSSDEDGAALARSPFVDEVLDLITPDPTVADGRLVRRRGPERTVLGPQEATTERTLARALARGGWGFDRAGALARLGVPATRAAATLSLFDGVPDPNLLPGPLRAPMVVSELAARKVFSANSLEGWVECSYRWFVNHELSPQRLEPESDPLWLGGVVHSALEQLYRDPPGEDSIPRSGDLGRWKRRFAELLEAEAEARARARPNRSRRAALDRARIQVEAFLSGEAESESEFRPDPELLELGFGPLDDVEADGAPTRDALELGEIALRGRIDRIDLARDRRAAIVRDYKTGKRVARAGEFIDRGTLQIQLYMLVAERILGLEPVAGLYQRWGRRRTEGRAGSCSPARSDSPTSTSSAPIAAIRSSCARRSIRPRRPRSRRPQDAPRRDRSRSDRRPVPEVLHVPGDLQAGARRRSGRRARPQRGRGRMSAEPSAAAGQLSLIELVEGSAQVEEGERTAEQRAAIAARQRDAFLEAGRREREDHGAGRALLRRRRRGRGRDRPDPRVHLHRARRGRDALARSRPAGGRASSARANGEVERRRSSRPPRGRRSAPG